MKKKWFTFLLAIMVVAGISGCGSTSGTAAMQPANTKTVESGFSRTENPVMSVEDRQEQRVSHMDKETEMNIRITVGNHTIKAVLNDNAAARQLYNNLPVTYPMKNLYGREMCYRSGHGSLPTHEAKDTGYKIGDISYWPPMGSLVILYKQNGEVFEQQPIGHTDDDISFLADLPDTDITFEKDE